MVDTHKDNTPRVKRLLFSTTLAVLLVLAMLPSCSDPTPAPEGAESTDTTAPTEAPTNSPTRKPQTPKLLTPLNVEDAQAVASQLSEPELECIGRNPAGLAYRLYGQSRPRGIYEETIDCLDDDTLDQIFLAAFLPYAGTLGPESSDCLRAAFWVIRPRAVMTGGDEDDPNPGRGGFLTVFAAIAACLNDQEWAAAAPQLEMEQDDRDHALCLMAALGGPSEMVTAMIDAVGPRGVKEGTAWSNADIECSMQTMPEPAAIPGPVTATPTPVPTATREAPTPEPTPTI